MIGEENGVVTFEDIRNNAEIRTYIEKGNENLGVLGFTKHSVGHATKVSDTAAKILEELDYDARTVELARIAGYMHDIGNCVNRTDHAHSGAIMAMTALHEGSARPRLGKAQRGAFHRRLVYNLEPGQHRSLRHVRRDHVRERQ